MDVAFLVPGTSVMDGSAPGWRTSSTTMLKVLAVQIGLGAVLAAVFWGVLGHVAGYSALLGSLVSFLPNAFLAARLAAPRRQPGARPLLHAAYIGEAGKLALTVLLFSIVFALVRPLAAGPFFTGFIVTVFAPALGLLINDSADDSATPATGKGTAEIDGK